MQLLETVLLVVHLLVALLVCGLVLLQHGKGADMGAAFGSGSSGSVFGSAGSANFLSRTTAILAAVFFVSSLGLTYLGTMHAATNTQDGVMGKMPAAPAVPARTSDVPTPSTMPAAPAGNAAPASATPSTATPAAATPPATPPAASPGATPAAQSAPAGSTSSKAGDVPK